MDSCCFLFFLSLNHPTQCYLMSIMREREQRERERERLGMGEGTRICFTTKSSNFPGSVVTLWISILSLQYSSISLTKRFLQIVVLKLKFPQVTPSNNVLIICRFGKLAVLCEMQMSILCLFVKFRYTVVNCALTLEKNYIKQLKYDYKKYNGLIIRKY